MGFLRDGGGGRGVFDRRSMTPFVISYAKNLKRYVKNSSAMISAGGNSELGSVVILKFWPIERWVRFLRTSKLVARLSSWTCIGDGDGFLTLPENSAVGGRSSGEESDALRS